MNQGKWRKQQREKGFIQQLAAKEQALIDKRVESGKLICDFCSSAQPRFVLICAPYDVVADFGEQRLIQHSEEDWMACEVCAVLIQANAQKELFERSVREFEKAHGLLMDQLDSEGRAMLDAQLQELQGKFWKYYMGEMFEDTPELREMYKQRHRQAMEESNG